MKFEVFADMLAKPARVRPEPFNVFFLRAQVCSPVHRDNAQTHRTIPAKGALERATQPPNPNTKLGTGSFLRALGR